MSEPYKKMNKLSRVEFVTTKIQEEKSHDDDDDYKKWWMKVKSDWFAGIAKGERESEPEQIVIDWLLQV